MKHFKNLLYVSTEPGADAPGLRQALALAAANGAGLRILVLVPEMGRALQAQQEKFAQFLRQEAEKALAGARATLRLEGAVPGVKIETLSTTAAGVGLVREVLRHEHDLLIKEVGAGRGFRALDVELMRQCPCPVWLWRPLKKPVKELQISVAIDPLGEGASAHDLSLKLFGLAEGLAKECNGHLKVLTCWDYPMAQSVRHNIWVGLSEADIARITTNSEAEHRAALDGLLREAGMSGAEVVSVQGEPANKLPEAVKAAGTDVLVMGTLARTGIAGLVMGNTAENVVQALECSVLAVKPPGFVSAVTAY